MPRISLAIVFISVFLAAALFAQGPVGTLNGTVTDQAGAVVPGATVVAKNAATGAESTTTTTSSGTYTLPYLPAGTYEIRVTSPGFRTAVAENVILRVAQTMTNDISLQVGGVNEQVTVSDKPELLESDSAEIGQYITETEYKAWPILVDDGQRQIQQFIFDSLPGTTGGTFAGSINGGQLYSHEILIEGIPVGRSDLSGGNNNEFSPSSEAISEFKLQTGAIGAAYNGGETAVANFTIKSGSKDLHGSGFYYVGNEDFNSVPLQSKTAGGTNPRNRLNNEGYSLGGPVYIPKIYNKRNRTFFFTNYEKTDTDNLVFSGFTTLPTPSFKNGDFSALLNPAQTGNPLSGTTVGTDALGRPIIYGAIYDPHTTRTVNGKVVRDPFPNNIIPSNEWDPVAKNVLTGIGVPDPQLAKLLLNEPRVGTCCPFFHENTWGIKIDHQINDKNQISGYYNQSYRDRNNSCGARYLPVPGLPTSCWHEQTTPGNMGRLSITSTVTPSLINRFAGGYNRFLNENGAPPGTINQGYAQKIGLQNIPGTMFPLFQFRGGVDWQGSGLAQFGVGGRSYEPNGSYIFTDELTWIHGKHSFRFGYDYRRYYYNANDLSDAGSFTFSPRQTDLPGQFANTGNSFASFLLGAVNNAGHGIVGYTSGFRQPEHAFYAQDDWKITPKLTVNVGLRWEVIPPFYEVTNRMSEVSLSVPDPAAGNRPGALIFGGPFNDTYWKEIGPRFGIAYRVSDKMVIRGGYAMTNTPPIANGWGYGGFNYGFSGTVNVKAGSSPTGFIDDPALYLSQPFPSLPQPLPIKDPSSAEYQQVTTTARDANRPGYVQNYNFTVQYQLPASTVLEVAFVGNKGTRMWGGSPGSGGFSELDGLPGGLLAMGDILNDPVSAHPQYTPFPGFDTSQPVSQALRPYPQYLGVEENFPYNTNSNYNSLQVTVTKHLTTGLGFLAAYTWSKALGYMDANGPANYYTAAQDMYNRGLERSVTSFNLPHVFKLTWVYQTPFGKGRHWDLHWANPVLGGWQVAAIHNYSTGFPINVYASGLNTPQGFGTIRPDVVSGVPVTLGGIPGHVDAQDPSQYLNPAAIVNPPTTANGVPLRVGTAPRYFTNVRGPAQLIEKFRISKKFPFWKESQFFEFGASMINPLKRTPAYIVDQTVGDAAFGQVLAGGGDRVMQLDARIEF